MNPAEFFETQRDRMVRRGDWTRACELNLLDAGEWRRPFRVLITRLSTYEDTSLSITHHYLYALVSSLGYFPDRAFLPPAKDEALWAEHGIPWLVGLQSRRPGTDFGLVAVSNAVAQEMGNLLWFLRNSGFPLEARERRSREDLPLVILGGANAPFSSLFWGTDSPVDGVYIGEDRQGMEALFRTVAEGRNAGLTKDQIVGRLAVLPGFLVPGAGGQVAVRPSRSTLDADLLSAMPLALGEGNAGKAHLAISGGCAGFCSFCAESWTRKPYAEAPADRLAEAALEVKAGQGASKLDVFSFNFNMHADLYPFLEAVVPWFSALGLKSQRFDSLAADPLLLELEKLFGKTWFTCGLEGISDRLRRALNKNLDTDQLRKAVAVFARSGVRELKAFLIATGWEEEADYEEFGRLLSGIRSLPGPSGRPLKVVFSVTPLVRFPHTPLEFEPAPDPREVDRSARRILRVARDHGFEGRIAASAEESAVCDLMLRPPTSEFFRPWAESVMEDAFVFRDEFPTWFGRHWKTRLEARGWNEQRLAACYGPESNRTAPWARLETGVRRSFLEAQYARNRSFRELVPAGLIRGKAADQALLRRWSEGWKARAQAEVVLLFAVDLTTRSVAVGRDHAAAALAQALMQDDPVVTRGYRGYRGCHWSEGPGSGFCALEGRDYLRLAFDPAAAGLLERWTSDRWARVSGRLEGFGTLVGLAAAVPDSWMVTALAPWPIDGQRLLTARGLKHTLRRSGPDRWVYDFPAATLKKGWLKSLESEKGPGGWTHRMEIGEKWDWRLLLEEGFVYPPEGGASRVRLSVTATTLPPR